MSLFNHNFERFCVGTMPRNKQNTEDKPIMVTTVAIALGCSCDEVAALPLRQLVMLYDSVTTCSRLLNLAADQVNDLGKHHGFEAVVGIRRIQ